MSDPPSRFASTAPWVTGLLLAIPVFVAYYPPMTDLGYHEAAIGLLRHWDDPVRVPKGLYVLNLGEPNQLFHMAGWGMSYLVSTRWAVKLLVAAGVAAVPIAAARFARHVGASPLAALVVAPMALGWLFTWGLVANLLGVSALLAVLPLADRLAREPSVGRAVQGFGALVLLYFAHMAMMVVFAGIALGLAVLHPLSWRKTALRVSPFAGGVALTFAQLGLQRPFLSPAVKGFPRLWEPLTRKLAEVPDFILPATDGVVQIAMLALCLLCVSMFFWLRRLERRAEALPAPVAGRGLDRARSRALTFRWELVAAAGFAAYLAFPLSLNGATFVYHRWFPPSFAVLTIVAAPRSLKARAARVARVAACALPVAALFAAWPSFADSNRQYQRLERLIPLVEPGSALAELDLGPGDPSRTYSLGPAYGRILATRGGRLEYAFTDSSISPVFLRARYQWNESLVRIAFDSWKFMPSHDLRRFRYVLIRTRDPVLQWEASYVLAREARVVAQEGEWILLESKLPVVSLLSPDVPLETPPPETMRQRVQSFIDAWRASQGGAPPSAPPAAPTGSDASSPP